MPIKNIFKTSVGVLVSLLCIGLALRMVNTKEMLAAFRDADYLLVLLSVGFLMISHYFRALRWRILLLPVKPVNTLDPFIALVIGYAGNSFLPAHLGEFLRAFVLGKKVRFSMSAILASIVLERLIDILSLLLALVVALCFYPGPQWLLKSGYLMFAGTLVLFVALVLLKRFQATVLTRIKRWLTFIRGHFADTVMHAIERFLSGIVPLARKSHYIYAAILSVAIWVCYGIVYYLNIVAFHIDQTYHVPWYATLVILVVTTISIIVPSSPGYVGTFHYLCQMALVMMGVNAGIALSYATVVHAVNVLPVTIVGFVMANIEGIALIARQKTNGIENCELKNPAPVLWRSKKQP